MQRVYLLVIFIVLKFGVFAQNYTSYFTGNTTDIATKPLGGTCLMGGAKENDEAMKWFLQRSNGGDILVLRTSGSDGYNKYLFNTLGVPVNSVESIVCKNANASNEFYIQQKIQQAEAIWFAGGDQSTYISFWRNTAIDGLINEAITKRHIVIGGTSAGMAILGKFIYSGKNGSVTSAEALANPYLNTVTIDSASFIKNSFLSDVITDTHYDSRIRQGRHATFLARIQQDWHLNAKGIACDEKTAVCIDETGLARVYGNYPASDDNAYFIQINCAVKNNTPENCAVGLPLTWNKDGQALKVYNIKGDSTGNNTFKLTNWKVGNGGTWQTWCIVNGEFKAAVTTPVGCKVLLVK